MRQSGGAFSASWASSRRSSATSASSRPGPQPPVEGARGAAQPQEECLPGFRHSDALDPAVVRRPLPSDQAVALQRVEVVAERGLPDADRLGQLALRAVAGCLQRLQDQPGGAGAARGGQCGVELPAQQLGGGG